MTTSRRQFIQTLALGGAGVATLSTLADAEEHDFVGLMRSIMRDATRYSLSGWKFEFEICDLSNPGREVCGWLKPTGTRNGIAVVSRYISIPGALDFGSNDEMLAALIANCPETVRVRMVNDYGVISGVLKARPFTGRVEGRW